MSDDVDDDYEILLIALLLEESENDEDNQFSDSVFRKRRRSGKIRRRSLTPIKDACFWYLYNSQQNDALITLCGFDHNAFQHLHQIFLPIYNQYTPFYTDDNGNLKKLDSAFRGRPRNVTSPVALAIVLAWTRTRGSNKVLQMIFGMTASNLSVWLRFGRRILVLVLKNHPLARVEMPSYDEVEEFKAAISALYPRLQTVWGAVDGLKLRMHVPGEDNKQSMFYNGWTHDHYVSNLFLFSPDGKIRKCFLNAPGCWHDSTLANASMMYHALDDIYHRNHHAQVVVDSAFNKDRWPCLIKSRQNIIDNQGNVRENSQVFRSATSVRQMAEWGMRGLQGSFPRLLDRLDYEERGERKIILNLVVLLYNFRASTVGMNQIRAVYTPHLEHESANYFAFF